MLNSINTNIAAYSAQGNIGKASNSAAASIGRLSSGNRIQKASDDVAALSIGTSLRTGVTTLKQALANTSQGTSLLQVADGSLSQISEILQRQKAIATQANSGTLSDTERGYLNQEFQALAKQIDQISSSSSFSSVKLLNGSLSGAVDSKLDVNDVTATNASSSATVLTMLTAGVTGDKITVNGVELTFTTSIAGTSEASGKIQIGATAAETASNVVAFLNNSSDPRLANYYFDNAAAGTPLAAITASWGGGKLEGATTISSAFVSGTAASFTTATGTIATTNTQDGLSLDSVRGLGDVTGSMFFSHGTGVEAGSAIVTKTIKNNEAFVGSFGEGDMGKIQGLITATDTAVFSVKIGDITYTTAATDIVDAAKVALTFTGYDETNVAAGGTFTLQIKGGSVSTFASQNQLDGYVNQINDGLKSMTFTQNRDVASFQKGAIASVGGVEVGRLDGMTVNYRSDNFDVLKTSALKISAPAAGQTDAVFEMTINGELFRSTGGTGNQINKNTVVALQSTTNPANVISFMTGNVDLAGASTAALDLSSQDKADAVAAAINAGLGLNGAESALNFQVGASSADSIGVTIDDVSSKSLYRGKTLDVTTLAGAQAAGAALDVAIGTINSVRANVGALQSRLDFTAANLQSSIQNQDAARGTLLDTDVAAESTAYATAQVQLQAGIAVLAQANQLPQNLLKLIS